MVGRDISKNMGIGTKSGRRDKIVSIRFNVARDRKLESGIISLPVYVWPHSDGSPFNLERAWGRG